MPMSVYEALVIMFSFGMLIISLITLIAVIIKMTRE
ncbi:putative holin-like toxin [Brevibacillus laterosporus]